MYSNERLCEQIKTVFPDIGECGIDVNVDYDDDKKAWVVDLKKDSHHLATHLEPEDADDCMEGKKCVGLAFQIQQLKENIKDV
ncbi:MAG: hypothetical protein SWH61_02530 [Thermodesulfobacteriota bacterium]|nr:hypothetical protein [Thermodesulfobacteriota bacterium]